MKRRPRPPKDVSAEAMDALAQALLTLRTPEEVRAFLEDLCTPAELEAMTDRWRVVPLLRQGVPYREIHDRTQVSVTTIGRVARTLERGAGGYATACGRLAASPASAAAPAAPREPRP
ncbi:YerC/YecD family TrpR-related protein [Vulcaniibacterium tengchongense]|uniref:Trp operon repressor family n=1 Tax=Vulcaniibacterium tengchongense TaxID=1273429 RepID=A0A3N4VS27_9GAMM|nr:YerC/YecD family TrpR-related protein [Vulcaniibacterium tengchongense]RPE82011.1 Trp operon repressor family [Vulcaniibacterium tengchongense]